MCKLLIHDLGLYRQSCPGVVVHKDKNKNIQITWKQRYSVISLIPLCSNTPGQDQEQGFMLAVADPDSIIYISGFEIATHWSPMGPKIKCW